MIFRTNKYYLLILLAAFIVGGCGNSSGNYEEIESSASSESTTTTDNTTTSSGLYVAVGSSGRILTSSDRTSWDNRSSGTTSNLVGVTYGNSKFLTLTDIVDNGTATVFTSTNGTSWTSTSATCSSCGTDNVSINDVTYKE